MATTRRNLNKRRLAAELLASELARLGRADPPPRLASPTARRGTRGKLGMATVCHLRHRHIGVVYIRTHGRSWPDVAETVRHEELFFARPSYGRRQLD